MDWGRTGQVASGWCFAQSGGAALLSVIGCRDKSTAARTVTGHTQTTGPRAPQRCTAVPDVRKRDAVPGNAVVNDRRRALDPTPCPGCSGWYGSPAQRCRRRESSCHLSTHSGARCPRACRPGSPSAVAVPVPLGSGGSRYSADSAPAATNARSLNDTFARSKSRAEAAIRVSAW